MVMLNIDMPASCEDCPYKGARWCYLEVLRKKEPKEVPKEGRAEWCPMREAEDGCYIEKETKTHLTIGYAAFGGTDKYGNRELSEVWIDEVKYGRGGWTGGTRMYSQTEWLRREKEAKNREAKRKKDRWYSVTEKEPDVNCLACDKFEQVFIPQNGIISVTIGGKQKFFDRPADFDFCNIEDFLKGKPTANGIRILPREIIAWRPLPKAYQDDLNRH